jgi:hypothetical protein
MEGRDAVGRGRERLEQGRRQVPFAPALHLARDRGEALGPTEMRLKAALRHLLLVLGRHARDHRHHALGRKIVDELRLRLVEPGRVQQALNRTSCENGDDLIARADIFPCGGEH